MLTVQPLKGGLLQIYIDEEGLLVIDTGNEEASPPKLNANEAVRIGHIIAGTMTGPPAGAADRLVFLSEVLGGIKVTSPIIKPGDVLPS